MHVAVCAWKRRFMCELQLRRSHPQNRGGCCSILQRFPESSLETMCKLEKQRIFILLACPGLSRSASRAGVHVSIFPRPRSRSEQALCSHAPDSCAAHREQACTRASSHAHAADRYKTFLGKVPGCDRNILLPMAQMCYFGYLHFYFISFNLGFIFDKELFKFFL